MRRKMRCCFDLTGLSVDEDVGRGHYNMAHTLEPHAVFSMASVKLVARTPMSLVLPQVTVF